MVGQSQRTPGPTAFRPGAYPNGQKPRPQKAPDAGGRAPYLRIQLQTLALARPGYVLS